MDVLDLSQHVEIDLAGLRPGRGLLL